MRVFVHREGATEEIRAEDNAILHDALHAAGIVHDAPCGGNGVCGKCALRVDGAGEPPPSERMLLGEDRIRDGWRLSCRTRVTRDMHVHLREEHEAVIQVEGEGVSGQFEPAVTLVTPGLSPPSLADPRDNWTRLAEKIPNLKTPSLLAMSRLEAALKPGAGMVLFDGTLPLDFRAKPGGVYGIAVDIGTTTVVAYLLDLVSGKWLDSVSGLNDQRVYGADVISRATTAQTQDGLGRLSGAIRAQIGRMALELCQKRGIVADDIFHIVLTGNTVMMHLLLGLPVGQIAVSPFAPLISGGFDTSARDIFPELKYAVATILPGVAGYIGADTVSAAHACGLADATEPCLLVDIGTNGEMVLAHNGKIICCSTAAGPAFEGAHIACGTGGVRGAVERVWRCGNNIKWSVIGGGDKGMGICGSGLVDAVAVLLDCGVLDETGRFDENESVAIERGEDGVEFVRITPEVYISQKDIREVQLAKGAVSAGIEILLSEAGIAAGNIARTYLAGGFGSHINPDSACRIGVLPKQLRETIRPVGNAAGAGARAALLEKAARGQMEDMRLQMEYIELSARTDFQDRFVENMLFE